jgi:hypothetical protein
MLSGRCFFIDSALTVPVRDDSSLAVRTPPQIRSCLLRTFHLRLVPPEFEQSALRR